MNKLILTPVQDKFKTWQLVENFREETSKGTVIVPKGSTTDLASVPRVLWSLLPPFGTYSQSAVIHDYLYHTQKFDRKTCDLIFYELMIKYKTYKWKAKIMYYAVRSLGFIAWKKNNKVVK